MTNNSERKKKRLNGERVLSCIFLILAGLLIVEMYASFQRQDIIADNPECILQLKQDYCAIYNMTYGSKVMMTGLLSKNAQTIEICYDDVNEFRLYRSDIDIYKCEDSHSYYYYDGNDFYKCINDDCIISNTFETNETIELYIGIK